MARMSFIVEYCYKYIRYHDFSYDDCAYIMREDFGMDISASEIAAEFEEYNSQLQAEKNMHKFKLHIRADQQAT